MFAITPERKGEEKEEPSNEEVEKARALTLSRLISDSKAKVIQESSAWSSKLTNEEELRHVSSQSEFLTFSKIASGVITQNFLATSELRKFALSEQVFEFCQKVKSSWITPLDENLFADFDYIKTTKFQSINFAPLLNRVEERKTTTTATATATKINKDHFRLYVDALRIYIERMCAFAGANLLFLDLNETRQRDIWRYYYLFACQKQPCVLVLWNISPADSNHRSSHKLSDLTSYFRDLLGRSNIASAPCQKTNLGVTLLLVHEWRADTVEISHSQCFGAIWSAEDLIRDLISADVLKAFTMQEISRILPSTSSSRKREVEKYIQIALKEVSQLRTDLDKVATFCSTPKSPSRETQPEKTRTKTKTKIKNQSGGSKSKTKPKPKLKTKAAKNSKHISGAVVVVKKNDDESHITIAKLKEEIKSLKRKLQERDELVGKLRTELELQSKSLQHRDPVVQCECQKLNQLIWT